MTKILLLSALLFATTACKKDNQLHNSSLVGKWKMTEYLADPGDGSGKWQQADPAHPAYLEFVSDGTLKCSPNNPYCADRYQVTSDSTMNFIRGAESLTMRYRFSETLLTIYPPCIEACGERFIPVEK